ncbi:hypothetical protein BDV37DRAFT_158500 [Aspergillus pseudonomiae]|uniref:Secreted protein n=1 Tax=Aspergillus pseudonomiae TaxID=1506151 RepID=A0A5N7DR71_9EURO|nr:uncharacterized protein BDV37DRAFT_158500 [Aspergillus pseudonomiae]KAE8408795.1 hypothetical protein BDV37DRAFT_158500 [Aspergillus pseudonomiae]
MKSMLALGLFSFLLPSCLFYPQTIPIVFYISYLAHHLRNGCSESLQSVSFWLVLRILRAVFFFLLCERGLVHVCFKAFHLLQICRQACR